MKRWRRCVCIRMRAVATSVCSRGLLNRCSIRLANEIWPHYDEYQTRTDRVIPVVVLERAA